MSTSDEDPAVNAGLAFLKQLERDGHLIKHPPGWQPPPITIDDFATGDAPTHEFVTDDGVRCIHCNGYPFDLLHWTIAG